MGMFNVYRRVLLDVGMTGAEELHLVLIESAVDAQCQRDAVLDVASRCGDSGAFVAIKTTEDRVFQVGVRPQAFVIDPPKPQPPHADG